MGLVEVTRVILPGEDLPEDATELDVYLWEVGRHWVFPSPVPCHGRLNLWSPPNSLLPALNEQLRLTGAGVELSNEERRHRTPRR